MLSIKKIIESIADAGQKILESRSLNKKNTKKKLN